MGNAPHNETLAAMQFESPAKKAKPLFFRVKIWFGGVFLTFIVSALGWMWQAWHGEAVGTTRVSSESSPAAVKELPPLEFHEGRYIQFSLPATYRLVTHETDKNPLLESFFLVAPGTMNRKIAIIVETRGQEGWEGSPAYKIRAIETKRYASAPFEQGEWKGQLFTSQEAGRIEKAAFFQDQGKVISIVLTQPAMQGSEETALEELTNFIKTLQWREKE